MTRCNVWILDGDVYHKGLLKFAVSSESLKDSVAVFVVDMSRPWSIMESLQKWTSVLREHVDKLKISPEDMRDMEQRSELLLLLLLYLRVKPELILYMRQNEQKSYSKFA